MEEEIVFWIVVQRQKEWDALNVVPVKMRDENVGDHRFPARPFAQLLAKIAEAGSTVENINMVVNAHFHARRVAAVTQVLQLGSRSRTTHAPELHIHAITLRSPVLPESLVLRAGSPNFRQPNFKEPTSL